MKNNKIDRLIIAVFAAGYAIFSVYVMTELPFLTWFDEIPLVEKYYSNSLTIKDMMNTYGEAGMLGTNILFILNTVLLGMQTRFEVFLNVVNVTIVGLICANYTKTIIKHKRICLVSLFMVSFFAFDILQGSSGGMDTQVRLGLMFCILAFYYVDKVLNCKTDEEHGRLLLVAIIFIVLSFNVFGTLYSFAAIPAVFGIILAKYIRKKCKKSDLSIAFLYCLCPVVYFFQYELLGKGAANSSLLSTSIAVLKNPIYIIKSLLYYFGSFVLGYPPMADHTISSIAYMLIGLVIVVISLVAILTYFRTEQYKECVFPLLMFSYSFFVWFLVSIGRYETASGDGAWMANNWYTVHTKCATIALVIILGKALDLESNKKIDFLKISILAMFVLGIYGIYTEIMRAPYERLWYLNMQPYLFVENKDELPVDKNGMTPLMHTKEVTWDSIETMRKYHLSIYRYSDSYEKMRAPILIISGIDDDCWVGKEAQIRIRTDDRESVFHLKGTYPKYKNDGEMITIKMDEEIIAKYVLTSEIIEFDIPFESNINKTLTIEPNFMIKADPPDTRDLSFVILDMDIKSDSQYDRDETEEIWALENNAA